MRNSRSIARNFNAAMEQIGHAHDLNLNRHGYTEYTARCRSARSDKLSRDTTVLPPYSSMFNDIADDKSGHQTGPLFRARS